MENTLHQAYIALKNGCLWHVYRTHDSLDYRVVTTNAHKNLLLNNDKTGRFPPGGVLENYHILPFITFPGFSLIPTVVRPYKDAD